MPLSFPQLPKTYKQQLLVWFKHNILNINRAEYRAGIFVNRHLFWYFYYFFTLIVFLLMSPKIFRPILLEQFFIWYHYYYIWQATIQPFQNRNLGKWYISELFFTIPWHQAKLNIKIDFNVFYYLENIVT